MSTLTPPVKAPSPPESLLAVARRQRLRRALPMAAVGILAMAASLVLFLSLQKQPTGQPVLILAHDVVAGHALTSSDLRVATVAAPGVGLIPASEQQRVVGRALTVSLPAGSLVSDPELAGSTGPAQGQAIVGAALKPGAFPADLTAGATVVAYAGAGNPLTSATVYSLHATADGNATVVSLVVPARSAGAVTQAATNGSLSLVWVTP